MYFHPLIICMLLETEISDNDSLGVSPSHTPSQQTQNGSICPAFVARYEFASKLTGALTCSRSAEQFPYENVPILG